jgi:3-oxoacyl-[acyl-carrier-protein] synthase II
VRRVVITGLGAISPLGKNAAELFEGVLSGRSGVRRFLSPFSEKLTVKVAADADFDPSQYFTNKQIGSLDRTSQMAIAAATEAWNDSGLVLDDEEREQSGVYMGTGLGGAHSLDAMFYRLYREDKSRVSPLSIVKIMCNAPASHMSIKYGFSGPCLTFSIACSSSSVAIGEAFHRIKYGLMDVALAGGTEDMMTYGSFKCWESLGVLAHEDADDPSASCKPFSKNRSGFVLGGGAAVVVLEDLERANRRGAKIYGELVGYGSTSDAYHITGPTVVGQERAMQMALREALISPDSVDYINAHGTATTANDIAETQAIKKVFGEKAYKVPVSSTKSMHGHLMGAGGAIEFIISLLAIKNKAIPPTANLNTLDPECDLDYVPLVGRTDQNVRTIMTNSFAFGGTNAVLVAREV